MRKRWAQAHFHIGYLPIIDYLYLINLGIMEYITDRITIDDNICNGRPTIRGTRISVQTVLDYLSAGDTEKEILDQYPSLESEDIKASIKFAADLMNRNYTIKTVA
jgi:uncharacterized protein (DUF433 family)